MLYEAAMRRWPPPVTLLAYNMGGSVYDEYPALFAAAFPEVTKRDLATLGEAGRFYAFALFAIDLGLDRDDDNPDRIIPLEILALLHEAYLALGGLFPARSPFWQDLEGCLHRFTAAMGDEHLFRRGKRDLSELTVTEAIALARDKCAVAEVTAYSLGRLAGRDDVCARVAESIAGYNVACQLLDDLQDWRADAGAGRPSLALAEALRVARMRGRELTEDEAAVSAVGRALYFGGAAETVITRAREAARQAMRSASGLPLDLWRGQLDRTIARADSAERALRAGVAAHPGTPRIQPALTIRLPGAWSHPGRAFLAGTLRWLLGQWRLGLREAAHVMLFPPEAGFTGPDVQLGDVFARALVAGSLLDADPHADGQLQPCIDREARYLAAARRAEPGLWSYFPALPELPPDADDAAEVLRVLFRHGAAGELVPPARAAVPQEEIRACLELAFGDCAHPDGSFETWLVPRGQGGAAARQREYVRRFWGEGPDVEVMANLLDVAAAFDPVTYEGPVRRGTSFVLAAQDDDGSWPATWYHGRLYAAYACCRLLAGPAGAPPDATEQTATGQAALSRCAGFIEARVDGDGGWAADADRDPDPVSTALALLALAEIRRADVTVPPALAERGLRRLARWQDPDGGMPAAPFIQMQLGRTGELAAQTLSYGSRTVTAALALRAATAWTEWDL
jgi:squalene-hopene/tetraprenyl-beta-curcumene cyclase